MDQNGIAHSNFSVVRYCTTLALWQGSVHEPRHQVRSLMANEHSAVHQYHTGFTIRSPVLHNLIKILNASGPERVRQRHHFLAEVVTSLTQDPHDYLGFYISSQLIFAVKRENCWVHQEGLYQALAVNGPCYIRYRTPIQKKKKLRRSPLQKKKYRGSFFFFWAIDDITWSDDRCATSPHPLVSSMLPGTLFFSALILTKIQPIGAV